MQRFTQTTLFSLEIGARFHYPGKPKEIRELVDKISNVRGELQEVEVKKEGDIYSKAVKTDREVIFLRYK